jgi:hypothetical protein
MRMRQPETILSTSKRRTIWVWLSCAVFVLALGLFVVFKGTSPTAQPGISAAPSVTNIAGAVPLAAFAAPETHRWRSVPRGTQVCDGITFVCDGAVRTAGLNAARDGNRCPGAVLGVPVHRRGSRIHLLQAAENTLDMTEGAAYGRVALHYANGESKRFELLFGVHGDDWLQGNRNQNDPVADPNTKLAWLQRRTGDGTIIRLYHTTLENALPGVTVQAIDFISPLSEANLLLFGLTIDEDSRPLNPSYGSGESIDDSPNDSITFTLHDNSDQPATGATLKWTAQGPRVQVDFPPFPADAQGQITIEVPRKSIRQIHYQASARDGSIISGDLNPGGTGTFPLKPVLKLALPGP